MALRATTWSIAAASALLTGVAGADPASTALERKLREQRADVIRWETRPLGEKPATAEDDLEVTAVGRVGPRTAVRFADGRVRWYAVAGFRPVLVVTRPMNSGDAVSPADTSSAQRDVIALACEPAALDDATRWRATRRLATGEALCTGTIEIAPEVERDRTVTLSAQRGGVSASRVLTAATDARAGETVRLHDPVSGTTVIAIVTGSRAARVLEEQK